MSTSLHDDFSRTPVTNFNLRPWWYLLIIEMGVMISIPLFVIGGQLGLGLSLQDLILSTFCGAIILGIIGALTARLGALTRCSTALIARTTFGRKGAVCIALLLAMGMTGWWGVQTELFADAVVKLANKLFQVSLPQELMIILGGGAMITTAALGIRAIGRLSYLAVPLLSAGLVYALNILFKANIVSTLAHHHPSATSLNFGTAAAIVTSGFIVGASMNPDYSRFAINKKHAFGYAFTDYACIYPLLLIASGIIAIGFHSNEIMIHLVPPGYSWLVFVMMMFATWAANDCNLYSSSLGLATIFSKWHRAKLAIFAGIVGIILAEFKVAEHMVSFLTLLGILIAPISGVFIVHAIGRKQPIVSEELDNIPNWHVGQLVAWFSGALIGYLTTPKNALGLGLFQLTTIPTLDAVLAAGIVMLCIRFLQNSIFSTSIPDTLPKSLSETSRPYAGMLDDPK